MRSNDDSRFLRATVTAALWVAMALSPGCRTDDAPRGYRPTRPGAHYLDLSRVTFDDGDTFLVDGRPIRVLGIDTPETRSPSVGIFENQPFGVAAAETTRALMRRARVCEIIPDGRDTYGRRLAHVLIDGRLLGVDLIRRGLAYETVSHFGDNGFPEIADEILDAARRAPKPPFEQPYRWRRKHQKRGRGR